MIIRRAGITFSFLITLFLAPAIFWADCCLSYTSNLSANSASCQCVGGWLRCCFYIIVIVWWCFLLSHWTSSNDMIRAVEKRQEWHRLPTCAKKCDIIAGNNSISCCTAVRRVAARWYYFLSKNQLLHGLPNMASREHPKSRWQAIMLSTVVIACC